MSAAKYPRRAIGLGPPFDDGTYWDVDGKQHQLPAPPVPDQLARLIEEWTLAADQATSIPSAAAYRMCADMLRDAIARPADDTP